MSIFKKKRPQDKAADPEHIVVDDAVLKELSAYADRNGLSVKEAYTALLKKGLSNDSADMDHSSVIEAWIREWCSRMNGCREDRCQLYESYTAYCESSGRQALTRTSFYRTLREMGFGEAQTHGQRFFVGLSLRKPATMPQEPEATELDYPKEPKIKWRRTYRSKRTIIKSGVKITIPNLDGRTPQVCLTFAGCPLRAGDYLRMSEVSINEDRIYFDVTDIPLDGYNKLYPSGVANVATRFTMYGNESQVIRKNWADGPYKLLCGPGSLFYIDRNVKEDKK